MLLANRCTGPEGATVSAANSGDSGDAFNITLPSTSVCTYSAAHPMHGPQSLYFNVASGVTSIYGWSFTTFGSKVTFRGYIYWNTLPSVNDTHLFVIRNDTGYMMKTTLGATNRFQVKNAASTFLGEYTTSVVAGKFYRVEGLIEAGVDTTNGRIRVYLYDGDATSELWSYDSAYATNTGTTPPTSFRFGKQNGTGTFDGYIAGLAVRDNPILFGPEPANNPPTADAGPDQVGLEPWSTVRLDGSASKDTDGTIASYAWEQLTGPAVTLSSTTAQKPTFVAPAVQGGTTLSFGLTVTDNQGAIAARDTVSVSVLTPSEYIRKSGVWVPRRLSKRSGTTWI